eukprot:contig_42020_g9530
MQGNAEAHFHLGLMYLRRRDGEEALRAFQHCKHLYQVRHDEAVAAGRTPSPRPDSAPTVAASVATRAEEGAGGTSSGDSLPRAEKRRRVAPLPPPVVDAATTGATSIAAQMRPAAEMWNALALLHLAEGGVETARTVLRRLVAALPHYADARVNLALADLATGREAAAVNALRQVLVEDPAHVEARSAYALICLRHGLPSRALTLVGPALAGTRAVGRGLTFGWAAAAVGHAAR